MVESKVLCARYSKENLEQSRIEEGRDEHKLGGRRLLRWV